MIGGQVTDIEGERQPPTAELLDSIHRAKTGALLRASVRMGGIAAGGDAAQIARFRATASMSAWLFRSWMTFWMWRNRPKRWARPRARMRRRARSHSRPFTASTHRERWRRNNAASRMKRCSLSATARGVLHEIADLIVQRKS